MKLRAVTLAVVLAASSSLAPVALAGDAEAGKKLAQDKGCAACHGAKGESPSSPDNPVLAGQREDYLV